MIRQLKRSGILLLDLAASWTIIWFLIWIFGGIINMVAKYARETALHYQLNSFRMVLVLYKELKGKYPKDLEELANTGYKVSESSRLVSSDNLLLNLKRDAKGGIVDAFGNYFYYDPGKGVVCSQTKGYENW